MSIAEYAVCFHNLNPPAGTAFVEADPGTATISTPWTKHEIEGGGTAFVNGDTGDFWIPAQPGEVPVPGMGECEASSTGGGTFESCTSTYLPKQFSTSSTIANVYSLSVRVESGTVTIITSSGDTEIYEAGDIQTWTYPLDCGSFSGTFQITGTDFEAVWVQEQ